ncbi:MAG TPA: hypothetical protein VL175_14430 [Pirellulales bacterium]|nr:hypothetical protein [Pirellulales bacterium]
MSIAPHSDPQFSHDTDFVSSLVASAEVGEPYAFRAHWFTSQDELR